MSHQEVNRELWNGMAGQYVEDARESWARAEPSWGIWRIPETDVGALPDVAGLDAIEARRSGWPAEAEVGEGCAGPPSGRRLATVAKRASVLRHARAIGALPFSAAVIVPATLLASSEQDVELTLPRAIAATPLLAAGLALFVATNRLFARDGEGTLAPWDPPSRLVVRGPYRRLRHPMITGVACVLLGEATLFGSRSLLVWFACFVAVNAAYLPLVEEPRLIRRFGEDYERYREQVPRWLPRPGAHFTASG